MRLQTEIPIQTYKDFENYCKDNDLKLNDVVRHLIRTEIYQEKSLERPSKEVRLKEEFNKYIDENFPYASKEQLIMAWNKFCEKKGIKSY